MCERLFAFFLCVHVCVCGTSAHFFTLLFCRLRTRVDLRCGLFALVELFFLYEYVCVSVALLFIFCITVFQIEDACCEFACCSRARCECARAHMVNTSLFCRFLFLFFYFFVLVYLCCGLFLCCIFVFVYLSCGLFAFIYILFFVYVCLCLS